MKRKSLVLILALLVAPSLVHATVLVSGSFENGYSPFASFYGGSEVVSDATAPDGSHSLRFNYPAGFATGNSPDIVRPIKEFFPDQEEVYIQFWIKYSSNFVDHDGGTPGTNKWVYIWFGDTINKPNLPIMGHTEWAPTGMKVTLQAGGSIAGHTWASNFNFTYGGWHKIIARIKMNTGGNSNGIIQIWVDDIQRFNVSNAYFRNSGDTYGITKFAMTPVYGGGPGGTPVPADQYIWFDHIIIQTTPFGTSSTPPPASLQPASPSELSIQ